MPEFAIDNFTPHTGIPLWVVDWESDDKHGVGAEPVIGWTLVDGGLYPIAIPLDGPPAVRRNKITIYDSKEDAQGDADGPSSTS